MEILIAKSSVRWFYWLIFLVFPKHLCFGNGISKQYSIANLDVSIFLPCLIDEDCKQHKLKDHACFMYFCHPTSTKEELGESKTLTKSLKRLNFCQTNSDCRQPGRSSISCIHHHYRRQVHTGVCVEDVRQCQQHIDCSDGASKKCCNGYCCNEEYFNALKDLTCYSNDGCQDLLMGELCCIDVMGSTKFYSANANWNKKCCDNPSGYAVLQPPLNMSVEDTVKIDKQIYRMPPVKEAICRGMIYEYMLRLTSCSQYVTTTMTTITTTTTTTTKTTTRTKSKGIKKKKIDNEEETKNVNGRIRYSNGAKRNQQIELRLLSLSTVISCCVVTLLCLKHGKY